jgi:hypothetical protein
MLLTAVAFSKNEAKQERKVASTGSGTGPDANVPVAPAQQSLPASAAAPTR